MAFVAPEASAGGLDRASGGTLGGSGRHHSQASTQAMQPIDSALAQVGAGTSSMMAAHTAMVADALHLARRLTKPPAAQLRSMPPNTGWRHSQACSRAELRAAQAPAIRMKTVVGSPGTKMPITPMQRLATAHSSSNQRSSGLRMGQYTGLRSRVGSAGKAGARGSGMAAIVPLQAYHCLDLGHGLLCAIARVLRYHAAMAIYPILKMGDARLLRTAQPVTEFDTDAMHQLVQDLLDTMRAANGAGLAAPQIGVDLQVVFFGSHERNPRYPDRPLVPPTVLVNPVITPLSDDEEQDWEGCLSVPGMRGMVPRWSKIRYTGFDQYGDPIDRVAEGFHARVVQHECDHLWGKLYPMRVRDFSQFGFTEVLFPDISAAEDD